MLQQNIAGFDWDRANTDKIFLKHGVTCQETEEVFLNVPLVFDDIFHSEKEKRYWAFGKTKKDRLLHITFTVREKKEGNLIRPISARDMHKKEKNQQKRM